MFLDDIVSPLTVKEASNDYFKRRQREKDINAGKPVAKQRQGGQTDYAKKRAKDKKDLELGESGMGDDSSSPVGGKVDENAWNAGDNAWSSEQDQWAKESIETEGSQDFNKVEPYEVCLAGKPVKTFDYYADARRFHDNWKKKLYREGNMEKAEKITLNPIMKDRKSVV